MARTLASISLVLLACASACAGDADEVDGLDDRAGLDGKADSPANNRVILDMANRATHAQLIEAELDEAPIRSIEGARAGADGEFGSADDVAIASFEDLVALPHIGATELIQLLTYADRIGPRHPYLPRGPVDLAPLANLEVLTEEAGPGSVGQPLRAPGAAAHEQVECQLQGENPGTLTITCRRDEAVGPRAVRAVAVVSQDGRFEAVGTDGTATAFDQYLRVRGQVRASTVLIDAYEFLRTQPCASGACAPQVLRHVKLRLGQSTPLRQGCGDDDGPDMIEVEAPAAHVVAQQCGTCYQRVGVCVGDALAPTTLACLHTQYGPRQPSTDECVGFELGTYQCDGGPTHHVCE